MGRGKKKFRNQQKRNRDDPDQQSKRDASQRKQGGGYADTVRENAIFEEYYKRQGIVADGEWEDFLACVREPLPAAFRVTGSKNQAEALLHLIKHDFFSKLNSNAASAEAASAEAAAAGDTTRSDMTITESTENIKPSVDSAETNGTNGTETADKMADKMDTTEHDCVKQSESLDKSNDNADAAQQDSHVVGEKIAEEMKAPVPVILKPPQCLSWYPDGLAWQLEYSRVSIRQNQTLKKLHSFLVSESESGNISRQESVSMIPPLLMDIKSHHKILDMCAAPGSKTAQIIEYLHADTDQPMPEGFVIGNDVDNNRCYLMVHQVKRLQSPNLMIINHDATLLPNMTYTNPRSGKEEALLFDRILCDVPCSGDGTMRKNPEVWRKWSPGQGINLHSVQNRVLQRGLELLAVGGRLVYSTCSFNPIENEAVIANMINKCEGSIRLVDCADQLPELKRAQGLKHWKVQHKNGDWFESYADVPENKQSWVRPSMFPQSNMDEMNIQRCIRIVPHHQNTGGFFIAIIEKTSQLPWIKSESVTADKTADSEVKDTATEKSGENNSISSPTKEPPSKKSKFAGFREEPFYYLAEDDTQWPSIKEFYGFDDSFDSTQLMVRSKESEKKRNIYLSAKSMRDVAVYNENKIKYINTGVKVLARSEHVLANCSYRLVQDGIMSVIKYIKRRRVEIQKSDAIELLTHENPFFNQIQPQTSSDMQKVDVGGVIMVYKHIDSETGSESDIIMTGWRGRTSCRVYVQKFERHHILRLCGVDPDQALVDAEWTIRGKSSAERQAEAGDADSPPPAADDADDVTADDVTADDNDNV